jgi:mannonate dehydratase
MENREAIFCDFEQFVEAASDAGLNVSVVEAGPPIGAIVLGEPGWEEQTQDWINAIKIFAKAGVEVICYNFMPQVLKDAMVVRTSYATETRGGAMTSAFRTSDLDEESLAPDVAPISREAMRANLARFLKTVLPVAEEHGIKMAMHPDDPPISPMGKLHRIMSTVDDFDWLLNLSDSPSNGLTLCIGCFAEMGCDVTEIIEHFKDRLYFVHFRNISGAIDDFVETFPDDGDLDLALILRKLGDIGYRGCIRPDHAPSLSGEIVEMEGYGFQGHVFTLGYMRGIMDAE